MPRVHCCIQWLIKLCRSSIVVDPSMFTVISISWEIWGGSWWGSIWGGGASHTQLPSLIVWHNIRLKIQLTCRFLVHLSSISLQIGLQDTFNFTCFMQEETYPSPAPTVAVLATFRMTINFHTKLKILDRTLELKYVCVRSCNMHMHGQEIQCLLC